MKTYIIFLIALLFLAVNGGTCVDHQDTTCGDNEIFDATQDYDAAVEGTCCIALELCSDGYNATRFDCEDDASIDDTTYCSNWYCSVSDADTCCVNSPTAQPTAQEAEEEDDVSSSEARTSLVVTIVFMALLCACGVAFFACLQKPKEAQGWLDEANMIVPIGKHKKLDEESSSESSSS